MEDTLVLLKPDAIQRNLVGEVMQRLEFKGLRLVGVKMVMLSKTFLDTHYSHLSAEGYYGELCVFLTSGPVIATCWRGVDAVRTVHRVCGGTKAREAEPGTIRGDLAMSIMCNVVHSPNDAESAAKEIDAFFAPHELYAAAAMSLMYSSGELA